LKVLIASGNNARFSKNKCLWVGQAWLVSQLHADEGDRLFLIEGPNGVYQLRPYDPAFDRKMKKAGNIIDRYRNTLHSLAK
jgi:hypothetical protein